MTEMEDKSKKADRGTRTSTVSAGTGVQSSPTSKAVTIDGPNLFEKPAQLKRIGGSESDDWNNAVANQTVNALWTSASDDEEIAKQFRATTSALFEINPKDPLEGMIAAQLLAGHNAAMECYRRAMLPTQTLEGRSENLNQANKLSRTCATLLEALNRHRGKGQQKVTVEHVHVHSGGQAIVGNVQGRDARPRIEDHQQEGGGLVEKSRINPMQSPV
jgi:hypothetical protein